MSKNEQKRAKKEKIVKAQNGMSVKKRHSKNKMSEKHKKTSFERWNFTLFIAKNRNCDFFFFSVGNSFLKKTRKIKTTATQPLPLTSQFTHLTKCVFLYIIYSHTATQPLPLLLFFFFLKKRKGAIADVFLFFFSFFFYFSVSKKTRKTSKIIPKK
jgi:hypothetical protein